MSADDYYWGASEWDGDSNEYEPFEAYYANNNTVNNVSHDEITPKCGSDGTATDATVNKGGTKGGTTCVSRLKNFFSTLINKRTKKTRPITRLIEPQVESIKCIRVCQCTHGCPNVIIYPSRQYFITK